eukprot:6226609-Alexandrium_andersonii.AAC.1
MNWTPQAHAALAGPVITAYKIIAAVGALPFARSAAHPDGVGADSRALKGGVIPNGRGSGESQRSAHA